ncbi:hypothetical protein ACLESO_02130 [Pyxidicoccus sp. 3LG]
MSENLKELLGHAVDALERHEEVACLEHLLEAWRLARAERIAALVERLSMRLTAGLPPLPAVPYSDVMTRHRPLELPRLLADVMRTVELRQMGAVFEQLRALRRWPADPRMTSTLLAISARDAAIEMKFFELLCAVFADMRDPRALEPLRTLRATLSPGSSQMSALDGAMKIIASAGSPPLDADAAARCEALEAALSAREDAEARSSPTRAALQERVYGDPRDVSARMVLADHLLELGDPLGELIMLQCTPRADRARIQRLVDAHGWRWTTPLGPHVEVTETRFERGLPMAVRLSSRWKDALPEPGPRWRAVREIDCAGASFPDLAKWLTHPNLGGVTTLKRVEPRLARELAEREVGVRQLGLVGPVSSQAQDVFPALARLPDLNRLFIRDADPEDVHQCAASRLASRLERFEARAVGQWSLVVMPSKAVPFRAVLLAREGSEPLARALRGAAGFGVRALRVRWTGGAAPESRSLLGAAVAGYSRVEWT